jgi:hypothetical protein
LNDFLVKCGEKKDNEAECAKSIPIFAHVSRVPQSINPLFVIHDNQNTTLIAKLVLMRIHPYHLPRQPSIIAQERITFFVRFEIWPDGPDAHDEARGGR